MRVPLGSPLLLECGFGCLYSGAFSNERVDGLLVAMQLGPASVTVPFADGHEVRVPLGSPLLLERCFGSLYSGALRNERVDGLLVAMQLGPASARSKK